MKLLIGLLGCIAAIVGYGFWDTYSVRKSHPDIAFRVQPVNFWRLNPDSGHQGVDHGTIFLAVYWDRHEIYDIVSIKVSGVALYKDNSIEKFNEDCKRYGSKNIRGITDEHINYDKSPVSEQVCFIRLKHVYAFDMEKHRKATGWDYFYELRSEIESIPLQNISIEAMMSNRPMRYVAWIEDKIRNAYTIINDAINFPFARP